MKEEIILCEKTQKEVLAVLSLRGVKILEDSTDTETRFTAKRGRSSEFSRTVLTCVIRGSLLPHGQGTEIHYRIVPGWSSLISMILFAAALLISLIKLFCGKTAFTSSACLFFALLLAAIAILYLFYFCLKKEVRERFLSQVQEE
ncbi:MAG: hypothetical protein IJK63_05540 [Oscillospiraceae bacterium]|nr:hypothetical protein [Oscillospiraceae bacterium]